MLSAMVQNMISVMRSGNGDQRSTFSSLERLFDVMIK